jgi:hypothetical protein
MKQGHDRRMPLWAAMSMASCRVPIRSSVNLGKKQLPVSRVFRVASSDSAMTSGLPQPHGLVVMGYPVSDQIDQKGTDAQAEKTQPGSGDQVHVKGNSGSRQEHGVPYQLYQYYSA